MRNLMLKLFHLSCCISPAPVGVFYYTIFCLLHIHGFTEKIPTDISVKYSLPVTIVTQYLRRTSPRYRIMQLRGKNCQMFLFIPSTIVLRIFRIRYKTRNISRFTPYKIRNFSPVWCRGDVGLWKVKYP